jgi:hypothetical protein
LALRRKSKLSACSRWAAQYCALPCARQRKTQELRDKFIKVVKEQTMCGGKGVPRAAATRCQTR